MADKMTKAMYFKRLVEVVNVANVEDEDLLVEFCEKQIKTLEEKKITAQAKAAEKRANDTLLINVKSVLTDEFQTADQIAAQIAKPDGEEGETISKSQAVNRLTTLVKSGEAVKESIKVDDKSVMAYKLA